LKLIITGRHTEVDKRTLQYIRKRFQKWTTFLKSETEVRVIVTHERYRYRVEVMANTGPYPFTGTQTTKDIFSAVDLLAEKIQRQLVRQHEKYGLKSTGRVRTARTLELEPEPEPSSLEHEVTIEPISGKPMSREEAVLQLAQSKKEFLVFIDVDRDEVAVLVRRKDNHFSLMVREE
jgi:putative sigma-54 modulation protein